MLCWVSFRLFYRFLTIFLKTEILAIHLRWMKFNRIELTRSLYKMARHCSNSIWIIFKYIYPTILNIKYRDCNYLYRLPYQIWWNSQIYFSKWAFWSIQFRKKKVLKNGNQTWLCDFLEQICKRTSGYL